MKKIVLLSGDEKALKDMSQWLSELPEEAVVETVADLHDFELRYLTRHRDEAASVERQEPAKAAVESSEAVDLDALGARSDRHLPIHLVIVDLQSIPDDAVFWVNRTKELLLSFGYSEADCPSKCMLIGYESTDFNVDDYRSDAVDDLVLMPLDKSLFLQKVELHTKDSESVRGSFLFQQRTDLTIDMGKDTLIEQVSEYGFAIRNPAPLASGVFARVISRIFGAGPSMSLVGRVYRVERHPGEPGKWLCYFTYHGITHEQLLNIRKFIKQDRANASRPSDRAWPSIDIPKKTIVVIDMNADARDTLKESLEGNFQNAAVHVFPSYRSFLKACTRQSKATAGEQTGEAKKTVIGGLEKTLAGAKEITLVADIKTGALIAFEPVPKPIAQVLGVGVLDLQKRPEAWLECFDEETREDIAEFLVYLQSGQTGHLTLLGRYPTGAAIPLRLSGRLERRGEGPEEIDVAKFSLRELTSDEWGGDAESSSGGPAISDIEGLYIDGSLLGENPGNSIEALVENLMRLGLVQSRESINVTVMGDERSFIKPNSFRLRSVQDFMFKPLDRKMTTEKASLFLGGMILRRDNLDLSFHHAGVPGRITKEVLMEELSEFGLLIRHEAALKEQTFLRFFSPVFLDETGDGLLARCLHSTKDPDTGLYHCFFAFFGVSDSQLKHIRNWIRGDYAARKEKAAG